MADAIVEIFLRDMTVPYFVTMALCMLLGILVFVFIKWIKRIRSATTLTTKERKKERKIIIIRTAIGLIFVPFVVAYFPEISEFLFAIEGGTQIAPVSALGSGMGIDRIIDQAMTARSKRNNR